VNNPIPANLKSEAKKAGKILREFTEISNRMGPDKLIPGNCCAAVINQLENVYLSVISDQSNSVFPFFQLIEI